MSKIIFKIKDNTLNNLQSQSLPSQPPSQPLPSQPPPSQPLPSQPPPSQPIPSQPPPSQPIPSQPKKILITVNKDAKTTNELKPDTSTKPMIKLHVTKKITNTETGPNLQINSVGTSNKPTVKLHVTKKISDDHSYEMLNVDQQLQPVPHDLVKLPQNLYLEPFLYQNYSCWINRNTGYIFLPNDIQNNKFEPIGQLIEEQPITKQPVPGQHLLPNRRIKWFYHFALDANDQ